MRYLIIIEYFGKNYCGWQKQANQPSVQGTIEDALYTLYAQPIKIYGSGRTDSGVHALAQSAHFDAPETIPADRLHLALNRILPQDIRVKSARKVPSDFHARFDVKEKTYIYKFYVADTPSPIRAHTHVQLLPSVDIAKMQNACRLLTGTHDFAGFSATGSDVKDTVRTVKAAGFLSDGEEVTFTITADGFLYNMVRIIVGTLMDIGKGKKSEECINLIFQGKGLEHRGETAPPQGLYLHSVRY
jgi:tRNA pseudouridine38-40 synthase